MGRRKAYTTIDAHARRCVLALGLSAWWVGPGAAGESHPPLSLPLRGEPMVILKLPSGVLMGNLMRTVAGVPEAAARYSLDNGFTWSDSETLFSLPPEVGQWAGLEALLDQDGEVHLFLLNDAGGGLPAGGEGERGMAAESGWISVTR